jgi:hypothetical protein
LQGVQEQEQDKDQEKDKEQANVFSPTKNFELSFDADFQVFATWIKSEVGFTPAFNQKLPKIYERWRENKNEFVSFVEGRKKAAASLATEGERLAWVRRAILLESGVVEAS